MHARGGATPAGAMLLPPACSPAHPHMPSQARHAPMHLAHSLHAPLQMRHDVLHPPASESCRSAGGVLRGSIPVTLTSGSTAMDSRGPSTAYGSLGSTFMGSTVYGSPNSCTLGDSRSTSGVVAVRSSGGAGVAAGALYGVGRPAGPGFDTQQQQQQQQQRRQAGAGSGGQQQLEVDAAAAAQPSEEAAPSFGRWGIAWDELERVQLLSKSESGQGQVRCGTSGVAACRCCLAYASAALRQYLLPLPWQA